MLPPWKLCQKIMADDDYYLGMPSDVLAKIANKHDSITDWNQHAIILERALVLSRHLSKRKYKNAVLKEISLMEKQSAQFIRHKKNRSLSSISSESIGHHRRVSTWAVSPEIDLDILSISGSDQSDNETSTSTSK